MGRGKQHGGRQVVPITVGNAQVQHEERTCPLCIELLDATEKQFFPCPCGYQVCLFCFERIKRDCSNLCPGCRTEYGSEKDPFQKGESRQRGTSASSSGATTPQKPRLATSQRSSPMPSPSNRQSVRSQRADAQSQRNDQLTSPVPRAPEPGGFPSPSRNTAGQPAAPGAHDHNAWGPTASSAGQFSTPGVAQQDAALGQPSHYAQSEHATTSAATRGSLHQATLSDDAMSSAGVDTPSAASRFRWASASGTLHSAAMRIGWGSWRLQKRRPDAPASDPEGAALTTATQKAVREGHMSSREGAAQLLLFLQRKEAQQELASAQESSLGNEDEHKDKTSRHPAVHNWSYSPQQESASGLPAPQLWNFSGPEHGRDNGGAIPQGGSEWALHGGTQQSEHTDGLSRFSNIFAAPLQQSTDRDPNSGGLVFRSYQNGL